MRSTEAPQPQQGSSGVEEALDQLGSDDGLLVTSPDDSHPIEPLDRESPEAVGEQNRYLDRQILGQSARVRYDVSTTANSWMKKVNLLLAHARNLPSHPIKSMRKWRMDRAKEARDDKVGRLQEKIDATTSSEYLRRLRYKKMRKYEDKLARRTEKYNTTANKIKSRLTSVERRFNERQGSIEYTRNKYIAKKELAVARKELRKTLRGPENRASRRETRIVLNEIFGSGSNMAGKEPLRDLGRKIITRQYAEGIANSSKWQAEHAAQQAANTKDLIHQAATRHDGLLDEADDIDLETRDLGKEVEAKKERLSTIDDTTSEEYQALTEEISGILDHIGALRRQTEAMREEAASVRSQHDKLKEILKKRDEKTEQLRAVAKSDREWAQGIKARAGSSTNKLLLSNPSVPSTTQDNERNIT